LGDAPQDGLHRVIEPVAAELSDLVGLTRRLIVSDWIPNQTIRNILDRYI
jgi:hypothetical protein